MAFLPVVLNMDYFPVLVIGGGDVAFRKTKVIYPFTQFIKIISLDINTAFKDFLVKEAIPFSKEKYSKEHLLGVRLCIAATDKEEVNYIIRQDCIAQGILCNETTSQEGQLSFPAFFNNEKLIASFYTYGSAPIVARKLKEDFKKRYEEDYSIIIDYMSQHRGMYNNKITKRLRKKFWEEVFILIMDYSFTSEKELKSKIDIIALKYCN